MKTLDAIRARCSVREYSAAPIPREAIETIVDCARLAPTARKVEPWEFIAVTDRKALGAMAGITDYGKFIASAAAAIVVCCKDTKYYLEDGCAATENILIAAADLGIGACWVAGDKKPYCDKILALLGAPAGFKLVSIIALGYPKKDEAPLGKRPLASVLHWDHF